MLRSRASRITVHQRTGLTLAVPAVFSLGGDGPVDSARIDAARFGWDAPPFSFMRRCIARIPSPPRVMRRRCLDQPAFRYPRLGSRGLVGPLFGVAKLAWVSVP
jgi:hypothetical protein